MLSICPSLTIASLRASSNTIQIYYTIFNYFLLDFQLVFEYYYIFISYKIEQCSTVSVGDFELNELPYKID